MFVALYKFGYNDQDGVTYGHGLSNCGSEDWKKFCRRELHEHSDRDEELSATACHWLAYMRYDWYKPKLLRAVCKSEVRARCMSLNGEMEYGLSLLGKDTYRGVIWSNSSATNSVAFRWRYSGVV